MQNSHILVDLTKICIWMSIFLHLPFSVQYWYGTKEMGYAIAPFWCSGTVKYDLSITLVFRNCEICFIYNKHHQVSVPLGL